MTSWDGAICRAFQQNSDARPPLAELIMSQRSGMYVVQEQPAFVVFSKGEQGGAALVRSILNRAVGAPQDAVKQVRHHTHVSGGQVDL